MQIIRTIVAIVLIVALLLFSFANWKPVEVNIWQGLVLETKIPALVLASFLLGLIPMWLLHRGTRWHLNRRIASLENAARTAAAALAPVAPMVPVDEPVATPTPSVSEPETPVSESPLRP